MFYKKIVEAISVFALAVTMSMTSAFAAETGSAASIVTNDTTGIVENAIESHFSDNIVSKMKAANVTFTMLSTEDFSALAAKYGHQKAFSSRGTSWTTDGLLLGYSSHMDIYLDAGVTASQLNNNTIHEVCHIIDHLNGNISQSDTFAAIINTEYNAIYNVAKKYNVQHSSTAANEVFAMGMTALMNDPAAVAVNCPLTYGFMMTYLN